MTLPPTPDEKESLEIVLGLLHAADYSKIKSIAILRQVNGKPLSDCKELVHFSDTWADRRENDDALHEQLFEALELLASEDPEPAQAP